VQINRSVSTIPGKSTNIICGRLQPWLKLAKIIYHSRDILVKHVVLLIGEAERNHHGQNSSAILEILRTHVPGVHFTVSGYLLLHAIFVQVLYFLVGRDQITSEFCLRFQMYALWNSAMWKRLPAFQNSKFTSSIEETIYETHVGIRVLHF
jgi:hypothetical protein